MLYSKQQAFVSQMDSESCDLGFASCLRLNKHMKQNQDCCWDQMRLIGWWSGKKMYTSEVVKSKQLQHKKNVKDLQKGTLVLLFQYI